ncbi:phosphinothricin N-acetyltransferase [Flexivirga endophytica]|uniref:Phosphinothricin N-acetyltransferase n=1 Tax=Flexivirga endophytica TaxID=1849103 RepID=A0A916WTR0_9MICO|nr:GNAT family N-acetyltransferase [Flexivirga endophytica]GGB29814.1 phosphinothricin N-acetyltransferase [Flexivirga endophytica]GHB50795.1 phosphinothricin N-acetyltransferase [Flexivirga endophytica]
MTTWTGVVRAGDESDLEELTRIYNHYVVHTPITFDIEPFTTAQRRPWLDAHPVQGPHRLLVAEKDGRLLGYATSSPFRPKPAYATSVETTVYLAPEETGRGVGSILYAALLKTLRAAGVHQAVAGVALPNEASQRLHLRCGFQPVGVFEEIGHKFGRFWDVAWFQQRLAD